MRTCRSCRFRTYDWDCRRLMDHRDPVTGAVYYITCRTVRSSHQHCGVDGRWWQPTRAHRLVMWLRAKWARFLRH